jgi:hypothetical protein
LKKAIHFALQKRIDLSQNEIVKEEQQTKEN